MNTSTITRSMSAAKINGGSSTTRSSGKRRYLSVSGAISSQPRSRRARIRSLKKQAKEDEIFQSESSLSIASTLEQVAIIDDVAAMNEVGIANLYAGDATVAKETFINALSRCSTSAARTLQNTVSKMTMSFQDNEGKKQPRESSSGFTCAPQLNLKSSEQVNGIAGTITSGNDKDTLDEETSNMHVYQREEYDEGMHVYKDALYLNKGASVCKPLRNATLMYNVGQTHLRTRQYKDAKRWFSLALTTFGEWKATNNNRPSNSLLNEVKIHHNIAFCFYCSGDNEQAMIHYQLAFGRLQTLALGDLDIAACCNSIGILHLCRGSLADSAKAMECLQLSLSIYKRILGHETSQVATCLSNIARVFFSRQDFSTALTLFQEALKIRQAQSAKKGAPAAPVDEAAAMFNIGQTHQKLGNIDLALKHFKAFQKMAEPVLGKGHRDVATCIKAMACIYYETGKIETACEMLEEAVSRSRSSAGEFPSELSCLLRDMGCLYGMTNQTQKALEAHMESLEIQRKLYDNDQTNPNMMVTLLHIAQNEKKLGNYTKAFNTYRTVYAIQLDVFGPKSLEVAATLCSIGLMLYLKQDLQSSLNYYQEALRVRQEFFKTNQNFDIAATFNSIGLIAFKMNKLDLAKNAFQHCIRIRVKLEGTDCHRDIVTLYSNLGTVFLGNGEDKEAIQMFAESIRLERKTLGEKHLGVAVSLQHLAQLHQDRGELEMAHEYFEEALEITREADGSMMANKHRTICTLLNLMGNIHLMKAEVPQMLECFTEATRVCDHDFNSLVIAGYTFYGISKMHPPCAPEA